MTLPDRSARMLVVFDLDGTLVDSVRDIAESTSELVVGLGGRALDIDEVAGMVGEGAALLVERALVASGLDGKTPGALQRFLEIYDARLLNHTTLYPGMRETLTMAAERGRLAVLTNKPLEPSRRLLEHLSVTSLFDEIFGGDGPLPRKPDPTALATLIAQSGGLPALMVGDSPIDWKTAEACGCPFAWARYGFGAARFDEPPPTPYVLEAPTDLMPVIDRLARVSQGA